MVTYFLRVSFALLAFAIEGLLGWITLGLTGDDQDNGKDEDDQGDQLRRHVNQNVVQVCVSI